MMREITFLYRIEKWFYENDKKENGIKEAIASDGEYRRRWAEDSIFEDLMNLQIPLDSAKIRIFVSSDRKLDMEKIFPKNGEGLAWNLSELAEALKEQKLSARQWELNGQPLEHWKFPKAPSGKTMYLYTFPPLDIPKAVEDIEDLPSWSDLEYEKAHRKTEEKVQKKKDTATEHTKGVFWGDLEYEKHPLKY